MNYFDDSCKMASFFFYLQCTQGRNHKSLSTGSKIYHKYSGKFFFFLKQIGFNRELVGQFGLGMIFDSG